MVETLKKRIVLSKSISISGVVNLFFRGSKRLLLILETKELTSFLIKFFVSPLGFIS